MDDLDQNVEFIFGKNNNYQQIGDAYLQLDITKRKDDNTNFDKEAKRFINIALAYLFKAALLTTTGGSDLEHNKYIGQVSRIMRLITSKDGDVSTCFDKTNENEIQIHIKNKY